VDGHGSPASWRILFSLLLTSQFPIVLAAAACDELADTAAPFRSAAAVFPESREVYDRSYFWIDPTRRNPGSTVLVGHTGITI
jgi:hypothetical protein